MQTLEDYIKNREIDREIIIDIDKQIQGIINVSNSNAKDIIDEANSIAHNYNKGVNKHNKEIEDSDNVADISEMEEISISLNNSNEIDEKNFEEMNNLINASTNNINFEDISADFFNHIVQQNHNMYLDTISLAKKTAIKFNLDEQEIIEHHRKDFLHNLSENDLNLESISFAQELFYREFNNFIHSSIYEEEFKQIIGIKIIEHYINNGLKTPTYYNDCKRKFQSVISFSDNHKYENKKNDNTTCDYLLEFIANSKKIQVFCISHYYNDEKARASNKLFSNIYNKIMSDLIKNPENIDYYFKETISTAHIKRKNSSLTEVNAFHQQAIENIMDFIISHNLYLDIKNPENAKYLDLINFSDDNENNIKAKKNIKDILKDEQFNKFNNNVQHFLLYCKRNEILNNLEHFPTTNTEEHNKSNEFKI